MCQQLAHNLDPVNQRSESTLYEISYITDKRGSPFCVCVWFFFFSLTAKKPGQISQSEGHGEGRFSFSSLLYLIWGLSFFKSYFILLLHL